MRQINHLSLLRPWSTRRKTWCTRRWHTTHHGWGPHTLRAWWRSSVRRPATNRNRPWRGSRHCITVWRLNVGRSRGPRRPYRRHRIHEYQTVSLRWISKTSLLKLSPGRFLPLSFAPSTIAIFKLCLHTLVAKAIDSRFFYKVDATHRHENIKIHRDSIK